MDLVSWDGNNINDGTNYLAIPNADFYGLPDINANLGRRLGAWPLVGSVERLGHEIHFDIYIRNTPTATYQKQLMQWFDPEDESPKQLIGSDSGGGNNRYIEAICTALDEVPFSAGLHYVVTLVLNGDVRWREVTASTQSWAVTATADTEAVTNSGEDDAYPIFEIQPTTNKSVGYGQKRWVIIRWKVDKAATKYPMDICNNAFDSAAEIAGGDMQADGDDLRVEVDGIEVDRWLDDINTNNTSVWVNLDWQPKQEATLNGAISDSDTTITINEDISGFPVQGILHTQSETITYTGRNVTDKQFTGCTRGAKGTSAAAHADAAAIYWVQHEIWLLYDNSTVSAPTVDADNKPAFELASSTNTFWDYTSFGENDRLRAAQWERIPTDGSPIFYGGNQGAAATPWVELGLFCNSYRDKALVKISNPCGITNANFETAEAYTTDMDSWNCYMRTDDGTVLFTFAQPTVEESWQAVANKDQAVSPSAQWVGIWLDTLFTNTVQKVEWSNVEITLDSSYTPASIIGGEQANYQLEATITNETTGESIQVAFIMELNQELQVNTDSKLVVYLKDNSNQYQALTVDGGPRQDWLALQPGSNTLRLDDVGTGNLTIGLEWEERFYH